MLGEIRMNRKKHEVTVAGEPVALTLKEYEAVEKTYGESEYCSDKR